MKAIEPEIPFPSVGKVSGEVIREVILPRLGAVDPAVLVPPKHGVDVGVVELAPGLVMALTTDPVFVVPAYGWERAAWFAVHILASDAATSGLLPRWMTVDLNLPLSMTEADFTRFWEFFHRTSRELGLAIVAGHTARYHGTDFPMVGGATVMATGPADAWVTPAMARPGDAVILTKGAAVEATALFAATFPGLVEKAVGPDLFAAADRMFGDMSVVADCRAAVEVGVRDRGVTSMHDATECGVLGGLVEVAEASGNGIRVVREKIHVSTAAEAVCRAFGMDPLAAISEGTLIISVRPEKADDVLRRLARGGIQASVVGEVTPPGTSLVVTAGGVDRPLEHPKVDPFWEAFDRAAARRP